MDTHRKTWIKIQVFSFDTDSYPPLKITLKHASKTRMVYDM